MKREDARTFYRAGEEPAVNMLCELSAKLEAQAKEIATLKKNSSNSRKPPSSGIVKPNKKKNNSTTNNKPGGQLGHSKHDRTPFNDDEIDQIWAYHCPELNGVGDK